MPNSLQIPPYRAALLTGADGAPVIRANGPDSELVMTERQWYMFWQNLAGQVTANVQTLEGLGNIATYGNHADRPDPGPWPDGALYVEQDRGSVLYQNQGGVWVYIAGQMFGTLSPDARPGDLGPAADVGFLFRTSTVPARAFAWNGGEWVETTPARYGTHAERLAAVPVADLVAGMLWTETDRGDVLYQNQGGTWVYLAGEMFGTLSPDARPGDLGPSADVGFLFRTDTSPARTFIWSGAAWIETTPIRYGTHAERLAAVIATLVAGMQWIETDRGNAIYQNQGGTWLLLTGTMWGTLSPDQRPTDLGVNDAGFTFLATTTPLREFVWSSTAWVETTAAQDNLLQYAQASGSLVLATTAGSIPGAALTLTRAGRHLITGCFDFIGAGAGDNDAVGIGQLNANGSVQAPIAVFRSLMIAGAGLTINPASLRSTLYQQWSYFAATAGQFVSLEARKNGGSGSSTAGPHCTISALWVSPT